MGKKIGLSKLGLHMLGKLAQDIEIPLRLLFGACCVSGSWVMGHSRPPALGDLAAAFRSLYLAALGAPRSLPSLLPAPLFRAFPAPYPPAPRAVCVNLFGGSGVACVMCFGHFWGARKSA